MKLVLVALLLLLPSCRSATAPELASTRLPESPALEIRGGEYPEMYWPRLRTFDLAYTADSLYFELRFFPDEGTTLGRNPGEWFWTAKTYFSDIRGDGLSVDIWPDRVDVFGPGHLLFAGETPIGSVAYVRTPTSHRFAVPRRWVHSTEAPYYSEAEIWYNDPLQDPGINPFYWGAGRAVVPHPLRGAILAGY